jgi:hypothetical protein
MNEDGNNFGMKNNKLKNGNNNLPFLLFTQIIPKIIINAALLPAWRGSRKALQ